MSVVHRRVCRAPSRLSLAGLAVFMAFAAAALPFAPFAAAETGRSAPAASRQGRAPVRVLFIGNSYIYYNNLPWMLEGLAAAADEPLQVQAHMVVEGGATLQDHWAGDEARAALAAQRWDYVVLQEQSTFGHTYLVEGRMRVPDDEDFTDVASRWVTAVERAGARAVLFAHWKRAAAPARDQRALDAAFVRAALATGATPAPVSIAWASIRSSHPDLELYDADGSHPSAAGSYLAACTLYALLFDRSPVGLTGNIRGPAVDQDSGAADPATITDLVALNDAEAAAIQRAAWDAVQRVRADPGALDPGQVPAIALPHLPAGRDLDAADMVGTWEGEARHYPDYLPWPADMRLEIERDGDALRARFTVDFGGRPDDIVREVVIERDGDTFEFIDPEGPNGGVVRYRGVYTGDALAGIGEILVEGAPIYGIGSWRLERAR